MIVDNNVSLIYSSAAVIVDNNVSLIYSSAAVIVDNNVSLIYRSAAVIVDNNVCWCREFVYDVSPDCITNRIESNENSWNLFQSSLSPQYGLQCELVLS